MTIDVKICGLSQPYHVALAAREGASHVGFIFFPRSPRDVGPEVAARCAAERGKARAVAVTVDAEDARLDEIVAAMAPDMLQLHGKETPERVAEVKARFGLPVIKAIAMRDEADLKKVQDHDGVADVLLLDAKPPAGADLPGGNGVAFDWSLVEDLATTTPVWLSGGIDASNIARAAAIARDPATCVIGLDLSSGAEGAPGAKEPSKIAALLRAAGVSPEPQA